MKVYIDVRGKNGFAVSFPYSQAMVEKIRLCLGSIWNAKEKAWTSEGPEILLDLERYGFEAEFTDKARERAIAFRDGIWGVLEAKGKPDPEGLYGFQVKGRDVMALVGTGLLGDEPGLGKTKQVLEAAQKIGARYILAVCPKTVQHNWLNEVNLWWPEANAAVLPDGAKARREFWEQPSDIVICNYEKLIAKDWPKDRHWDIFIPDEIQRAKDSRTLTHKAIKAVSKMANFTQPMSGSPMEIRLEELYSVFSIIRPSVLGGFIRFRAQHMDYDDFGRLIKAKNLGLLRQRISPWMIRRTKAEVLHQLPPKQYQDVAIDLTPAEQSEYAEIMFEYRDWLKESGRSPSEMNALTRLIRLRQFCCSPQLLDPEGSRGSKWEEFISVVQDWPGRVVVFSEFRQMITLLANWLSAYDWFSREALIDGGVSSSEERLRRVEAFNRGELGKVFLSTDAGQLGINLTGADLCVHWNPLWNPQKMIQREDRLHRIGQTGQVTVMNLLAVGTIDMGMSRILAERRQLFQEVIEGTDEIYIKQIGAKRLQRAIEGR